MTFDQFYQDYHNLVNHICSKKYKLKHVDVQDISQEVFIHLSKIKGILEFPISKVRRYIHKTTQWKYFTYLENVRNHDLQLLSHIAERLIDESMPDISIPAPVLKEIVWLAPPNLAIVLEKFYVEGKPLAKASKELNITPEAARTRLHRGREKLREEYQKILQILERNE